jgi:hypothetical protein
MTREEIEKKTDRLRELDDKYYRGGITASEETERAVLRAEIQRASRLGGIAADKTSVSPSVAGGKRITFRDAISQAERQIRLEEHSRAGGYYYILHDMCRVMAEVYMMHPDATIRIGTEDMAAGMVAEVMRELSPEMAETVAERLMDTVGNVRCLKAYMRAAVYNAVFEMGADEARTYAQIKRDMEDYAADRELAKLGLRKL